MSKQEINLKPINLFIKRYENAIASRSKEIRLSIEEAGLLNAALVNLLTNNINDIYNSMLESAKNITTVENADIIEIKMDAGSFK